MNRKHFVIVTVVAAACMLMYRHVSARADFPSDFSSSDVDDIARKHDCDKLTIDTPLPGLLLLPRGRSDNTDGKYHQRYHAACRVYVSDRGVHSGSAIRFTERFIVYGASHESSAAITRVARMLLLLWDEEYTRLHHDHTSDEPTVQVWLSEQRGAGLSPDTGGEQFKSQIYIYDVLRERRPIEWAREVAHEYGHYALPGISGFKAPEEWANGVLGERLYLKWITEDLKSGTLAGVDLPFVTGVDLTEYTEKQVDPLIRRVDAGGASAIDLSRRDAEGMDNYTALALYIDRYYGSGQLLRAMSYTAPARRDVLAEAPDFLRGFQQSVQATDKLKVTIEAGSGPSLTIVHSLYLPTGHYSVDAAGSVRSWQLASTGKLSTVQTGRSLAVAHTGWFTIKVNIAQPAIDGGTLTLSKQDKE